MSESAKGTQNNPGRHVRAKSGLNRSILDQGWYQLRWQLEYKPSWPGDQVLAIIQPVLARNACCGYTHKDNRKSQSGFICIACGYQENADINDARNILAAETGRLSTQSATL